MLVGEENIHRLASLQQREDVKRRVFGEVGRVSLPFATDFIAATAKNSEAEQQGRTAVALRARFTTLLSYSIASNGLQWQRVPNTPL